jgi:hypothetical protein
MADLSSFNLPEAMRDADLLLKIMRDLLVHIEKSDALPDRRVFRHITDYAIGQFERCGTIAFKLDIDILGWTVRNLFELSFLAEWVCASDQNIQRLVCDYAIDDLEIWEKLSVIDERAPGYVPYSESIERTERLRQKIAAFAPPARRPLKPSEIARAVNRETEYTELNKVYSKLSHATAWAILGGSEEPIVWEKLALLLLLKATGYAGSCLVAIAKRTAFSLPSAF